jgi:hypothetical protein
MFFYIILSSPFLSTLKHSTLRLAARLKAVHDARISLHLLTVYSWGLKENAWCSSEHNTDVSLPKAEERD